MSEEKEMTPAEALAQTKKTLDNAFAMLLRRGLATQAVIDVIKPVADVAYNTVKDHTCFAGSSVLMSVGKSLMEVTAALSAFEDHIHNDHNADGSVKEDESNKPDSTPELVTERKDNVIHVDLSKGRKN